LDRSIEPTTPASDIDMTPWKHFKLVGGLCLALMVLTFVIFSPIGLVKNAVDKNIDYGYLAAGSVVAILMYLIPYRIFKRMQTEE
jgi:uncharacterized sodium:solute symporter family permease YidK